MGRHGVILAAVFSILTFAQQAPDIFARGQNALNRGDLRSAEQDFRAVLALEPQSLPARANLGVVYMRARDWTRALDQFRLAEQLSPGNPGIELNKGLAYFHRGEYASAIPAFQKVLASNPASLQARYLLGLSEFAGEKYSDALANLQPLWDSENSKLPYLYMLALSADKTNNTALEQKALGRMYDVGRDTAAYHLFLGRAWLAQQRDADSMKEFAEAVRLDSKLPFAHYSLGTLQAKAGNYRRALDEFKADAAIEPDLALNYEELGNVYLRLDSPREAEQAYRAAIKLDAHSVRSRLGLAKLLKARADWTAALAQLDEAEKLDQQSASLHYLRAQVLNALNRHAEAKTEFALSARLRQSTRDRLKEQVSGQLNIDAAIAFR